MKPLPNQSCPVLRRSRHEGQRGSCRPFGQGAIIDGDIGDAEQRQDEGITSLNRILYSLRTDGLRTDHRTHLCGRESVRIASRPPRTYPRCVLYGHRRDPSRYVRITS